ncbi:histidine kinase [Alienimonas californiensis]|uniref:Sensory histidine kinase CreC n=1 Tax=Alienimonas californiensis TaxID=2527989 RepID=A0A517PEJ4_9PLAN|nr:hypothetical protein [Alienimonas californiensis]QDT17794.1 sensory histidine kinase CreC [Alienimonas californiensis]
MPLPSTAATDGRLPASVDEPRLERPVLTVTGAVGLLVGSLAWALTGQFAAAPLVFAASLTTALALAIVLEDRSAAMAAFETLTQELRATRGRLDVLEPLKTGPAEPGRGTRDLELNDLLLRAAAASEPAARRRGVTLRTEPSELYLAVHADAALLERRFASLLNHAIAASPADGVVQVRSRLSDDQVVAEVEYAGSPQEALSDMFGSFPASDDEVWGEPTVHAGRLGAECTPDGGVRYSLSVPFGHRSDRDASRRHRVEVPPVRPVAARPASRRSVPA